MSGEESANGKSDCVVVIEVMWWDVRDADEVYTLLHRDITKAQKTL